MPEISPSDRAICEQRVLVPGNSFFISHRFAPPELSAVTLALAAFFASVRSIPGEVSDPSVGLAKLSWWQQEIQADAVQPSQHPVVRSLRDSGSLRALDEQLLAGYFQALAGFMMDCVTEDEAGLLELAEAIGGREALLEAGCGGATSQEFSGLPLVGAARFLWQMTQAMPYGHDPDSFWVPLNLQARFGVTAHSLSGGLEDSKVTQLTVFLGKLALDWQRAGLQQLGPSLPPAYHHLLIRAEVERRQLAKLIRNPRDLKARHLFKQGVVDVVAAWNLARRLRRKSAVYG